MRKAYAGLSLWMLALLLPAFLFGTSFEASGHACVADDSCEAAHCCRAAGAESPEHGAEKACGHPHPPREQFRLANDMELWRTIAPRMPAAAGAPPRCAVPALGWRRIVRAALAACRSKLRREAVLFVPMRC